MIKHGHTVGGVWSLTYSSWASMVERCTNKKQKTYLAYGGRGIRVCPAWLNSFEAFLSDMGERPSSDYSIDRIDNDGNYEPGNCRWATRKEQNRKKSDIIFLTLNGIKKPFGEWVEITKIPYDTLRARYRRGLSDEEVLTKPYPSSRWA